MRSNKLLILIFMVQFFGCISNKMLDNSFFYNTTYYFKEETCYPLSNYNTAAYKVFDGNFIYKCDLDTRSHKDLFKIKEEDSTSVFFIMNKNHKRINEISFEDTNKSLNGWFIGYDNDYLMAFRTTSAKPNITELISVNLKSNELTNITDLSKGSYGISEHPISKNDILVFSSKGWAHILDVKNKKLNTKIFEYNGIYSPVISKDGTLITYLSNKQAYVYNIKTGKKEMMYDLNTFNNFYAYRVYFKNNEELIVKGNKFPDNKILVTPEYLVIKDKKIIDKGQIDINNGYKYY